MGLQLYLRKNTRLSGFSLAEILTIIAVITLILFISFPTIKKYRYNIELNNSTKYLVSNLKLAQQYTVAQQHNHSIRMDILASEYYLIKLEPVEEILNTYSLEENIIFSEFFGIQNNEAVYIPTGSFENSGYIILTHQNTNNQNKIYLKPSGYVTWEKIID